MKGKLSNNWRISYLIASLILAALACNAPIEGNETPGPPPTIPVVDTPEPNQAPTETSTAETVPTLQDDPTATITATNLPTFTPIQATVPPNTTPTQTLVPTGAATTVPLATATSNADSGPLGFTFTISWAVVSGNPGLATATVSIAAMGGGGEYQYFRDDLPVEGPIFQYEWATCRANPGSLRVTSADGQTLKVDYFEQPPCPTS